MRQEAGFKKISQTCDIDGAQLLGVGADLLPTSSSNHHFTRSKKRWPELREIILTPTGQLVKTHHAQIISRRNGLGFGNRLYWRRGRWERWERCGRWLRRPGRRNAGTKQQGHEQKQSGYTEKLN
jgi:hypothetical protein